MIRLFTAIPLPQKIRAILHGMGRSLPGARPVPLDQIHITLRFIGEIEGSLLQDIKESLSSLKVDSFSLAIRGVGHFPPRGQPRVIWAGLYPTDKLSRLKRKIDSNLQQCGIPSEQRKFSPHVSLARLHNCPIKRVTEFLAGNSFLEFDELRINQFNLYSSKLTPKGAIHTLEQSFELQSQTQS